MKWVHIEWEDAWQRTTLAWNDRVEWEYQPLICKSVGFVLYEGPEGFIITDSLHDEQTGHVLQIPMSMVKQWKTYENE